MAWASADLFALKKRTKRDHRIPRADAEADGSAFGGFTGDFLTGGLVDHLHREAHLDVLKEGQDVKVKLLGFDDRGKVRLAMKMVDQTTGAEITSEPAEG